MGPKSPEEELLGHQERFFLAAARAPAAACISAHISWHRTNKCATEAQDCIAALLKCLTEIT